MTTSVFQFRSLFGLLNCWKPTTIAAAFSVSETHVHIQNVLNLKEDQPNNLHPIRLLLIECKLSFTLVGIVNLLETVGLCHIVQPLTIQPEKCLLPCIAHTLPAHNGRDGSALSSSNNYKNVSNTSTLCFLLRVFFSDYGQITCTL